MKLNVLIGPARTDNLTLGYTDYRSTAVIEDGWETSARSGSVIDVLSMMLHDQDASIDIKTGYDIVIAEQGNPNNRLFGGLIVQQHYVPLGLGRDIHLTCQDYTTLLDRATVRKTYEVASQTDRGIIQDAFVQAGLTEINTSAFVQTGRIIPTMNVKGSTLRTLLDQLAEITGFIWRVDYHKNLIYKSRTSGLTGTAPIRFGFSTASDDVDTFPFYNESYTSDIADFNFLELQGGKDVSDDQVEIYAGDGVSKIFTTGSAQQANRNPIRQPRKGFESVEIQLNTGSQGSPDFDTELVVGLEGDASLGLGSPAVEVLWNPLTRRIEFDTAPLDGSNGWRIKGRYLFDLIIQHADTASIARLKRIFKASMIVPEATELDTAVELALAFMRENTGRETIIFTTNKDMTTDIVGDTIKVTDSRIGLDSALFVVNSLSIRLLGGETFEYIIEAQNLTTALIFGL